LNATLFNNLESFLDQIISSAVADANITANGSGALTAVSETLTGSGTALTVQHNATVSGNITVTGSTIANGGLNTNTVRDNVGGTTAIDLSAGGGLVKLPHGAQLTGGALQLLVGSFTRVSVFSGSATSSGTLQAHGLGVKPDWVQFQQTGASGDGNSFQWDINATDATNVKVWTLNASARFYVALAIKL